MGGKHSPSCVQIPSKPGPPHRLVNNTAAQPNRFERHPLLTWLLILTLLTVAGEILLRLIPTEPLQFAKDFREIYRYHDRWFSDFEPETTTTIRLTDGNTGYFLNFLVSINEHGFRWHDRLLDAPLPDPAERKVIHAIGDSFTMGWGVNYESSFPALMEESLGDQYAVLNLGLNGFGTIGATEKSLILAEQFPPAAVIYLVTENDYEDDDAASRYAARPALLHRAYDLLNVLRRNTYLANVPFALRWWLYYRQQRVADGQALGIRPQGSLTLLEPPGRSDPEIGQASKQSFKHYLATLRDRDVPLLVIAHGKGPVAADFARFSAEQGVPTHLLTFHPGLLLQREGHLNRAGNRLLAQYAEKQIAKLLRADTGSTGSFGVR